MTSPHIAVLGGGPAGVGAAFQLRRHQLAQVTLLEQQPVVGGNAGSFEWRGQRLDYGSHRLHHACDPAILSDIQDMLGKDLLDRPRHGRIRLRGHWLHFPLKPIDVIRNVQPGFVFGIAADMLRKKLRRRRAAEASFADVLAASLGETICHDFYFPYARKIWGVEPSELSGVQARRRVSANSFAKLLRKVASQVPGLRPPGGGRFFYPRQGYGQITEAYAQAAVESGAHIWSKTRVTGLTRPTDKNPTWTINADREGVPVEFVADHIWSTLPLTIIPRLIEGDVPSQVSDAASNIRFRAMIIVYVALDIDRFTEFDAHYFPGPETRITRLSEPKNYANAKEPSGRTILCAELPCAIDDTTWQMSDSALGELVSDDLATAGISLPKPIAEVRIHRVRQAYPIYLSGYERYFDDLTAWIDQLPNLLTFGRQGLFAHDNTHHALAMAYGAADCFAGGKFDWGRWQEYLEEFSTHVVED